MQSLEPNRLIELVVPTASIWQGLSSGTLRYLSSGWTEDELRLELRVAESEGRQSSIHDKAIHHTQQVLNGIPQKQLAIDDRVSASTIHASMARCLYSWGLDGVSLQQVPTLIIAAAQAAHGRTKLDLVRCSRLAREETTVLQYRAARPDLLLRQCLSPAEFEVARLCIDGWSQGEIAERRNTSARTVANQLSGVRDKLGVVGRIALLRYCLLPDTAAPLRSSPMEAESSPCNQSTSLTSVNHGRSVRIGRTG